MLLFSRLFIIFTVILLSLNANAADSKVKLILVFGDSIVGGYGVSEKNSLPVKLEKNLVKTGKDIKVINGGVSGDTTSGGRSRLEWTLKQNKPDYVVLALGGNDMLRGVSPEIVRKNIDEMLGIITKQNIPVILSAVNAPLNLGPNYTKNFNAIYPELSEKYDVPLYPFFLERIYGNKKFMQPDGIHPNSEGVNKIVKDLAPFIVEEFLDK